MDEKVYRTGRGDIHYWVNSRLPGRPTLVFLPGLTADHRLFDRQVAAFEERCNLLVWDAPGHGASRPFALDFSLDDKAGYLREILLREQIDRPVLVGQSMGGYVAQCYLERFPGTLAGFVSIDSAPLQRRYVTAAEIWLLKRTAWIYAPYPWKALQRAGISGVSETPYGRQLMAAMMSAYSRKEYCALACHGYRILAEAMEADRPYRIDCPCLLLCGEHDRAASTLRYNRSWAKTQGLPLVWIEGAGHNSNTDNPAQVNRLIADFVRTKTQQPGGAETPRQ